MVGLEIFVTTPTFNEPRPLLVAPDDLVQLTLAVYSRLFIAEAMFRVYH